jgi:hypothetical protein
MLVNLPFSYLPWQQPCSLCAHVLLFSRILPQCSFAGWKDQPIHWFWRRLDGKPLTQSAASASSPMLKHDQLKGQNGTNYSKPTNPASHQPSRRLVFGSNAIKPKKEAPKGCLSCLVIKLPQFLFFFILLFLHNWCKN